MLYAILCYDDEKAVSAWTKEQDDSAMVKLAAVQEKLAREGKLGPVARLMPTKAATTLRKGRGVVLLGFFVVDCATPEEALEAARELGRASSSNGAYEIRPISVFHPGIGLE
jgi:hypothetical protein